jgi:uncharacterized protein involved in exopolysaccharide biosynthesis
MTPEQIGTGALVLGFLVSLYLNVSSVLNKPKAETEAVYRELTKAITDLKTVVEVLTTKFDATDKLVEKLDKRLIVAEKRITGIELTCASKHGHKEPSPVV